MNRNILVIGFLLILSLATRLADLGGPSVWTDEAATVAVTRLSPGQIVSAIAEHDMNPPGSYLLFHFWGRAGGGLVWLRALSVLFGTATVLLLYLFGATYFNHRAGIFAALVFLAAPLSLSCMRQVRYPAMLAFFILSATWAFVRLIEASSRKTILAYGLLGLACAYVHYYSAFMFGFHALLLVTVRRQIQSWKPFAAAFLVLVAGYVPWLPALLHQLIGRQAAGLESDFPWLALVPLIVVYTTQGWTLWSLPHFWTGIAERIFSAPMPDWMPAAFGLPFIAALLIGLFAKSKHPMGGRLIAGFALAPIGFFLVLSLFMPLFSPQYFMGFLPALALGAAVGMDRLIGKGKLAGFLIMAAVFAVSLGELATYYKTRGASENWKEMVAFLREQKQPGDLLLVPNLAARFCVEMYDRGGLDLAFVTASNKDVQVVDERMIAQAFLGLVNGYKRVWFVEYYPGRFDPDSLIPGALRSRGFEAAPASIYPDAAPFTTDPRLRLTLFIQDPSLIAAHLPREMAMSDLNASWLGTIVKGVYPGQGPMRWMARSGVFLLPASRGDRVCASGFAPSMLYPASVIGATYSLHIYPPGSNRERPPVSSKEMELLGEFWICSEPLTVDGPVELTFACHDSFVPDDHFNDGDRSEKCLQLRRVWVESAPEPGNG